MDAIAGVPNKILLNKNGKNKRIGEKIHKEFHALLKKVLSKNLSLINTIKIGIIAIIEGCLIKAPIETKLINLT
jgi:hypothetical protein